MFNGGAIKYNVWPTQLKADNRKSDDVDDDNKETQKAPLFSEWLPPPLKRQNNVLDQDGEDMSPPLKRQTTLKIYN